MAMVCLTLSGKTIRENLDSIDRYRRSIDLAELRADFLDPEELPSVAQFAGLSEVPVILTVRRAIDGGCFEGDESARLAAIMRGAGGNFAYVDLESDLSGETTDRIAESFTANGTTIIRSRHDFDGVPDDAVRYIQRFGDSRGRRGGEIPKLATMPKSSADFARLVDAFDKTRGIDKILLGMGSYGFATRILAGKLGSLLTFTSIAGTAAAPGHIDPETLHSLYRFSTITPATPVYGVIGNPVMHSRSPHIHNPALAHQELDGVYVPFHVDEVDTFLSVSDTLDVRGLSVTVPHKENVLPYLRDADESVQAIGSCNTIRPINGGDRPGWEGTNTDAPGFLEAVKELVHGEFSGVSATVVGAGGTARAVVYALCRAGSDVLVVNRTEERAGALAEQFGCVSGALSRDSLELVKRHADLIVQATSVGMSPETDNDPLEFYEFDGHEAVFDAIYSPEETKMLARARAAGCGVENGRRMLYEQAYIQYELFTGREYPREITGTAF